MGRDLFCKLCNTFIVGRDTPEWLLLPLWAIHLLTYGISFDRIKKLLHKLRCSSFFHVLTAQTGAGRR